jgi:molybdate/tungstate transport system permease protein
MKLGEPMTLVFLALGGLVLLFILAPLVWLFINATPGQLAETAVDPVVVESVRLTLLTSMAATAIMALAAVPFSWVLARRDFPFRQVVNAIVDLPIVIPHSAAGIALLGVLAPGTPAGKLGERLGISFVGGHAGIIAAMAFVSVPFLISASRDGFAAVPVRIEQAALNLGASPLRVFFTISVPMAWRSVLSGLILMWARGMSEFGAVLVIAYHPIIAPVLIYERLGAFGLRYAVPVTVLFVAVCLAFFVALRVIAGEQRRARG